MKLCAFISNRKYSMYSHACNLYYRSLIYHIVNKMQTMQAQSTTPKNNKYLPQNMNGVYLKLSSTKCMCKKWSEIAYIKKKVRSLKNRYGLWKYLKKNKLTTKNTSQKNIKTKIHQHRHSKNFYIICNKNFRILDLWKFIIPT